MSTQNMEVMDLVQEASSAGHDGPDKDMPAVFQCQSCNLIISDSTAFIAAHDDLKSITVNRVNSSVELSSKLITSTEGVDQGSTFSPLVCQGCQAVLGKVYKTTPRPLDDLRDCYSFDVNKLSVYQVGSSCSSAISESDGPFQQYTNLKALKETTLKLQVLMCAMHQRILNIEQSLEIEDPDVPENSLQPVVGLLVSTNTSGLSSVAKGATKGGSALNPIAGPPGGKDSEGLPGFRNAQEMGRYPVKDVQKGSTFERVDDIHQTSDSESSGATTSSSRGARRGRGQSSKTPRGRRGGGRSSGKENEMDKKRARGTKRTKDFGEISEDQGGFQHELEGLSPIRKKSNTRQNKPV